MRPAGRLTADQRLLLEKLLDEQGAPRPERIGRAGGPPDRLPLSAGQRGIWFLDQLQPGSSTYHVAGTARIRGPLDTELLRQSLTQVVRRHETLRSTFHIGDAEPYVRVHPAVDFQLPVTDLSGLGAEPFEAAVADYECAMAHHPFDLTTDLMVRASLLRGSAEEHLLLLCLHHIAADGWSLQVLLNELTAAYAALSAGAVAVLPDLPIQYADYAAWQRAELERPAMRGQLEYWKEQLAGAPLGDLPLDSPRAALTSFTLGSVSFELEADLVASMRALGESERATPYMVLLAAFVTVLSKWGSQPDVTVGASVSGRGRPEIDDLIGCFVNIIALRIGVSASFTFRQLVRRVRDTCLVGYEHQDVPFEHVVRALQPSRDPAAHTPLFRHTLVLYDAPNPRLTLPGVTIDVAPAYTDTAKFELRLELTPTRSGTLSAVCEYAAEILRHDTVRRFTESFATLLAEAVANPDRPVGAFRLVTDGAMAGLLGLAAGPAAKRPASPCMHQLFEIAAESAPEAAAIADDQHSYSYAEVERRANQVAHYLRSVGAGPEHRVGVCLERSAELVVAMLGVLKAGAAFVPLDPEYPVSRLTFMAHDSQSTIIVTRSGLLSDESDDSVLGNPRLIVRLDKSAAEIAAQPTTRPDSHVSSGNCAYVVYTSGSTGQPKGVMVDHAALVNLIGALQAQNQLGPDDAALCKAPASFDVFIGEWAWPLTVGARVVVAGQGDHADPAQLVRMIRAEKVTACNFVPVLLRAFLAEPEAGACGDVLRLVMCGGEELTAELVDLFYDLLPGAVLQNLYGPTEAAIDVTAWPVKAAAREPDRQIPLGIPLPGVSLHVLDSWLQAVPLGVPGELYIGGSQVARGYCGRPGLTAERFVPDPFTRGGRLYRTGDAAKWRADGTIGFLGRFDHQVKLRGQRIELGEIETVMSAHPAVARSVVTTFADSRGDRQLAAYIQPTQPRPGPEHSAGLPGRAGEAALPALVRAHCAGSLPAYMIPATIIVLADWPLRPNGKVDRTALPPPTQDAGYGTDGVAPRTETEHAVARIWRDLLDADRVGIFDNFFEMGGHSLLAARLAARVRAGFGTDIPLARLLREPTVAAIAAYIDTAGPDSPALRPIQRAERRVVHAESMTPAADPESGKEHR
jgi:amino acid adenylation domain-containing protein